MFPRVDVFVGMGANLDHPVYGRPAATLTTALGALEQAGAGTVRKLSGWFESAPVPRSDQNWYVNAVAQIDTKLPPRELLDLLHNVEAEFGRIRCGRNEARLIDLDLIDYGGLVRHDEGANAMQLPHPRCCERRFVLYPLRDIAPRWRHPASGVAIDHLISRLPASQIVRRVRQMRELYA